MPASKILLALDGKEVEKKDSSVSETGKAPRQYVPLSLHPPCHAGQTDSVRPLADCNDPKLSRQYLVIRMPNAPESQKLLQRPRVMRAV